MEYFGMYFCGYCNNYMHLSTKQLVKCQTRILLCVEFFPIINQQIWTQFIFAFMRGKNNLSYPILPVYGFALAAPSTKIAISRHLARLASTKLFCQKKMQKKFLLYPPTLSLSQFICNAHRERVGLLLEPTSGVIWQKKEFEVIFWEDFYCIYYCL